VPKSQTLLSSRTSLGSTPRRESVLVRGLDKSFGSTTVLRGVDLDVPAGTLVSLLGPSGCGKTTLLRMIAGLERPDAGQVVIGGRPVSCAGKGFVAPENRRVGMVFQDWALFPHLSVERNIAFGLSKAERRGGRVQETLDLVGLAPFADRMPGTLSGGQQQRVALARALATRPSIIMLDEPFSNLDTTLRVQIRLEVQHLLAELGVTTLFVTHDQEEAFVMGDIVGVMFDGEIVQQGRPGDVYDRPGLRSVAEFIGDANFLQGVAAGTKAVTHIGPVPLQHDIEGDVEVMVRPEYVVVAPGEGATVESVEFYGHDAVYLIQPDAYPRLRARVLATPEFRVGERVCLSYDGRAAVAFHR
jgi:iron(III) transport system ATP-binding protein